MRGKSVSVGLLEGRRGGRRCSASGPSGPTLSKQAMRTTLACLPAKYS